MSQIKTTHTVSHSITFRDTVRHIVSHNIQQAGGKIVIIDTVTLSDTHCHTVTMSNIQTVIRVTQ